MKKLLLVGAVVVAGAVVATPKYASSRFEQQMQDVIAQLNAAPGYKVTILSNEQGWFSAKTQLALAVDLAQLPQFANDPIAADLPQLQTDVTLDTKFGPLLFDENGLFGLYSSSAAIAAEPLRKYLTWDAEQPLYKLVVTSSLTNSLQVHDEITAANFSDDTGRLTFKFSGYEGDGSWSGKTLHYAGNIDSLTSEGEFDAAIKDIKIELTADTDLAGALAGDLYASSTTFTAGSFTSDYFNAAKLLIKAANTIDSKNDTSSIQARYELAEAHYQDININNMMLSMDINNIDNGFLRDFQQLIEDGYRAGQDTEAVQMQMASLIEQKLPELLKKSPQLNFELGAEVPEGKLSAKLDSSIADITQQVTAQQLTDKFFWLQHLKAHLNANADKGMATFISNVVLKEQLAYSPQFAQMSADEQKQMLDSQSGVVLDQLIQTGMLQEKDGKLVLEAAIEQGQTTLNGNPIPL
ncbi:YdgA family protein [Shewanella sp. C32]|uniref:YdgA family protein n=1 Tax=Shewanella electrica TaxID=515560 RepID=A0ABT2FIL1_9GAMM|nr:DUF945 family protein [Shewanella electrica]MCH1924259.1 YdgA family protein [Shewanella electrica]MCS4556162.1 YdgA family protein [Shewanella electrica]